MSTETYPIETIREDFPILKERLRGFPLLYLDNAATSQKPRPVLEAMEQYYQSENANVHRGIHQLSTKATARLENARKYLKKFLNASSEAEIIFTKGTTEAVNLVASGWGRKYLGKGDEILISAMEHHSNLVPWQLLCQQQGATLRIIPLSKEGETLDMQAYEDLLSERTKLVALVHVSNALGRINPVAEVVEKAKKVGARVLIDGSQAIAHMRVDVQELDADFYAFSGHKVYGPMGVGVLYGKERLLEDMLPYQSGGEMIKDVSFSHTTFNDLPYKFEAGTPNVSGICGLHAALKWIEQLTYEAITTYEEKLQDLCSKELEALPGLHLFAKTGPKVGICAFIVKNVHTFDIGQLLDVQGIAVRTGHHCTQPLMQCLGIEGCVRASFACYNTTEEVLRFIEVLRKTLTKLTSA